MSEFKCFAPQPESTFVCNHLKYLTSKSWKSSICKTFAGIPRIYENTIQSIKKGIISKISISGLFESITKYLSTSETKNFKKTEISAPIVDDKELKYNGAQLKSDEKNNSYIYKVTTGELSQSENINKKRGIFEKYPDLKSCQIDEEREIDNEEEIYFLERAKGVWDLSKNEDLSAEEEINSFYSDEEEIYAGIDTGESEYEFTYYSNLQSIS